MYKALKSFSSYKLSMGAGEIRDLSHVDKITLDDLTSAGYIKRLGEEKAPTADINVKKAKKKR